MSEPTARRGAVGGVCEAARDGEGAGVRGGLCGARRCGGAAGGRRGGAGGAQGGLPSQEDARHEERLRGQALREGAPGAPVAHRAAPPEAPRDPQQAGAARAHHHEPEEARAAAAGPHRREREEEAGQARARRPWHAPRGRRAAGAATQSPPEPQCRSEGGQRIVCTFNIAHKRRKKSSLFPPPPNSQPCAPP